MDLDFETNKYDLFDDWHQNKTKQAFTQKLQQQAQIKNTKERLKNRFTLNSSHYAPTH